MLIKLPGGGTVKQFTFWAHWKGGSQHQSTANLNGKGLHTMRGVYEKVKGSKDFYIRYTDANGSKHREHVGRYSTACEAVVNRRREVREGRFVPPRTPVDRTRFNDLADAYMLQKRARAADNTIKGNQRLINRLKVFFGNAAVRDISPTRIDEALLRLKYSKHMLRVDPTARGASPKVAGEVSGPTLNSYRCLIFSIFKFAIKKGQLKENPVAQTESFERHEGIVRYMTADEEASLRRVIRAAKPEFLHELDLTMNTGLRRHEQRLLTWDKIDLERGILTVPSETKTGRRFIPINSVCRAAILKLHELSNGSEYVCPRRGWNTKNKWMRRWLAKAGVMRFRPSHDFRHTFASRLVMAGVDLRTVQQFMGHADITTTMRYAHLSPEHGKAAIERLVPQSPVIAAAPALAKRPMRKYGRAGESPIAAKPAKIASVA